MSWQRRIPRRHRARIIVAHQEAWQAIEARGPVETLNYQAESDRLGYILVELWQAETPEGELVALAMTRFDTVEQGEQQKPSG